MVTRWRGMVPPSVNVTHLQTFVCSCMLVVFDGDGLRTIGMRYYAGTTLAIVRLDVPNDRPYLIEN